MLAATDIKAIEAIVGADNVSVRHADLEAHSVDESWIQPHLPDLVVWPATTGHVSQILCYANERSLPVVPWSGGSSLEGNPVPVQGGILMAMYRMNQIVEVRENDLQVVVQPGIVYDALNAEVRRSGMFFPPAPGSADVATIGGMVANNASGMRAVKYGVTRDYVLKLKVALADGSVIDVGSNAKKTTSGYDLLALFVGSEGTLGVITEVTLRLLGLPEQVSVVVTSFTELADAADTVYEAIRYGLSPSAVEILDVNTIRATNREQHTSLRETPTLFVEFHGNEAGVQEQIDYFLELCEENNQIESNVAATAEAREELWSARSEAHDSIKFSHPGCAMIAGDICVPISQFSGMVEFVSGVAERENLTIYAFGHAGDGNLHTETIARREHEDELARAVRATDAIIEHAIEVGGTVAGEHGVGMLKRHFMALEHGDSLKWMQAIKGMFDPRGILNPGKIFPALPQRPNRD